MKDESESNRKETNIICLILANLKKIQKFIFYIFDTRTFINSYVLNRKTKANQISSIIKNNFFL